MTENFITGGTVAIEDGTKAKEEFAPARKVKIELSFSVPEGEEGQKFLRAVADVAEDQLRSMLGRPVVQTTAAPAPAPKVDARPPKAPKAKEKTKEDLAREAGVLVDSKPADGLDESDGPALKDDDDLSDLIGEVAPITDTELGKAAQETNGRLKSAHGDKHDPTVIRKLIAEFSDNKRINDIPAAKRQEFLNKLKALK